MTLKAFWIAVACAMVAFATPGIVSAMGPELKGMSVATADEQKPAEPEQKAAKKVESSNPLSGDTDAIDLGRRLFGDWCSVCHGIRANGESRFGKYAANLTKFWRGYKEFTQIVKNGRTGQLGMMPPFGKPPDYLVLDDDSINKIGAFLETLAEEGANWK